MSLLVTGSIGIDTVETPFGKRDDVIGGSAIYFSYAASFFTPVRLVGVVGEDCPSNFSKSSRAATSTPAVWKSARAARRSAGTARTCKDMNEAVTVEVDLNVLAERAPKIPAEFSRQQIRLPRQHAPGASAADGGVAEVAAKLIVADTMNLWIQTERPNCASC